MMPCTLGGVWVCNATSVHQSTRCSALVSHPSTYLRHRPARPHVQVERADDNLAAARAALRNAKHTYDAKLQEHGWVDAGLLGGWAGRMTC